MTTPRRILVTGGGKGVGAAIVRRLSAAHYDVDFTYRSSAQQALELAARAAAIAVTRKGAAASIPALGEVLAAKFDTD